LSRWWPAGALVGFTIALFWQYFFLDYTLYAGDTAFVFLPLRTYVTQRLGRGELPLWKPHLFGGTPALALPGLALAQQLSTGAPQYT
jgi:hypothetical protein